MPLTEPRAKLVAVFAILAAAACIAVPAWQLIGAGPFEWHVRQPAFWQGGLEALTLVGLVSAGCALDRRWTTLALVVLPLAFYLRRHAVDVPLLLDVVYLEIIVGLGACALRALRLPPPRDAREYLHVFVLGFLLWSMLAWSASALDFGAIRTLRWLTLLLAVPAACGGHTPFVVYLTRQLRVQRTPDRLCCGALAAWIAVLYARSGIVFGYDSLWYGLRPEYVLDPGRSVFEPLGLVSPVHYFPKLYEVFLLPVSALGDSSSIDGMTIWMLVLVLLACHCIAQRIGLPARTRMPVLLVIATLPALANSSLSPKPDVISVLFVLLAADAALAFAHSRARADAAWLVSCGTLACVAKLIAIPYVGMLALATLATLVATSRGPLTAAAPPTADARRTRLAVVAAIGSLVVAGFVTARSWLLAGMPTVGPDPLIRLWHMLGMHLHAPVGTLIWTHPQDWASVPLLIVDWLMRPQRLPHVVISWVGNFWLWCAVLAFAASPLARTSSVARVHSRWPLGALITTGVVLALSIRYQVRGSDGNYFLAALLPAMLVGMGAAFARLTSAPRLFAAALACVPAFALFQAGYAFASAGWVPGTRSFDLDLSRHWHNTRRLRWVRLQSAGLERIGHYLKEAPGTPRVVGYAKVPAALWLPARFEHLATVSFSRPQYVAEAHAFLCYLREQEIDYLILPKIASPREYALVTPAVRAATASLEGDPDVHDIDDRNYRLLDLTAVHRRRPDPATQSCTPATSDAP